MPYTLNGVGTWYWGRRNIQSRMATCAFCGAHGELKSYDTTLHFVIAFLPVIPLGRKRILDECPSCRRHRAISLRQFQRSRQKDLSDAIQAMKAEPRDPTKAAAALQTMLAYQDAANFNALAPVVARTFPQDKDLLALVADGLMFFNQYDKAEAVLRLALRAHHSLPFQERLAAALIHLARPAEAEPLMSAILSEKRRQNVGLLLLLVEGYQSAGHHAAALSVLDRIAATWPDIASDKEMRRHRRISERRLDRGAPVRSALLASPRIRRARPDITGQFARYFTAAILIAAAGGYLSWCVALGRSRAIHVVNGTDTAYSVTVNDKTVRLRPKSHVRLDAPEGDWNIRPTPDHLPIEPATVSFRTPLLFRPFVRKTLVLNPDRVAILTLATIVYAAQPTQSTPPPAAFHCGRVFYDFDGIDHPFTTPPAQISVSEYARNVTRTQLLLQPPLDSTPETLAFLQAALGREQSAEYCERRAQYQPEDGLWLFGLAALANPQRVLAVVRPRLTQRPLLIEWHRVYQMQMKRLHPEHDLAAEYRGLAAGEPDEPALAYLLGRVTEPPSEADKLFAQSEQGPQPIGYGFNALAYSRLCDADFAQAADFADQALAVRPDLIQFRTARLLAYECAGRFASLAANAREQRAANPADFHSLFQEYTSLCALGKETEAETALNDYQRHNAKELDPQALRAVLALCRSFAAYHARRTDDYLALCRQLDHPSGTFAAAVTRRDAEQASAALDKMENAPFTDHLLVFSLAKLAQQEALAARHWDRALHLMKNDVNVEPKIPRALQTGRLDNVALLTQAQTVPREKSVLLMACGLAWPEHRPVLHAQAARFNAHPGFPHAFIADVTAPP